MAESTDPHAERRNWISASRKMRDDRLSTWQKNVEKRKAGKGDVGAESNVSINQDWPLTKAKIAQLYSQTPQIRLKARVDDPALAQLMPQFEREVNDLVNDSAVGDIVGECLADVVNASGIGAVLVSCEKLTVTKDVPNVDPMIAAMTGIEPEMIPTPMVTDIAYPVRRISPADLLIGSDFTGSNYDHARRLGHEGRMTWSQGKRLLGLTDDQKEKVLSGNRQGQLNTLNTDAARFDESQTVRYQEIFERTHYFDENATSFNAFQRVVFVDGIDEPVIDEPYSGQMFLEDGTLVGMAENPIAVLTLTYISDDPLPPSDSTIARAQVDELEDLRSDMSKQRKHSIPVRWFDSTRVGPATRALLEKGDVQHMVPTMGPGDRAFGEVSRASYPPERFEQDRIVKGDIHEIYQTGSNQAGAFGPSDTTAAEANIVQRNFQTRVGQDRDRVAAFFVGIARRLAGLKALHGQTGLPNKIAGQVTYGVRVDSTMRLDANTRIEQLTRALNLTAQSGFVNPKEPIAEIWELSGVDPSKVVIDPQPKAPEPVKVSVSKAEDLVNPIFLALLMRTGQGPTPEDISAAIKLLTEAMAGGVPVLPPEQPENGPPSDPEKPKATNTDWETPARIERRADDGGA